MNCRLLCLVLAASGLLALGAGCSVLPKPVPDDTRYYVLTGPALDQPQTRRPTGTLHVGLATVRVAPYLDTRDMVVRSVGNQLDFRADRRWAEPLPAAVGRMVAARLLTAPHIWRVYAQPYPFEVRRDYDLRLEVLRCEGERRADGAYVVSFACVVELTEAREAGGAVVLREVFNAPPITWDGQDFSALAAGVSQSVQALAEEVLAKIPVPGTQP